MVITGSQTKAYIHSQMGKFQLHLHSYFIPVIYIIIHDIREYFFLTPITTPIKYNKSSVGNFFFAIANVYSTIELDLMG